MTQRCQKGIEEAFVEDHAHLEQSHKKRGWSMSPGLHMALRKDTPGELSLELSLKRLEEFTRWSVPRRASQAGGKSRRKKCEGVKQHGMA